MAIRPPVDDLYRTLGVDRRATPEELTAAFRGRARELHPDVRPALAPDPSADEAFKRVSHAYSVLRDPQRRARYDAGLDRAPTAPSAPAAAPVQRPAPTPTRGHRLTRRGARWLVAGGIGLLVLGMLAAAWVVALQRRDSDLLARGVPTSAVVVEVDGRRLFEFQTHSGRTVRAEEATRSGVEQPAPGDVVHLRYDRSDPSRVVLDASHTARNVTLWIVAVKFLVGGAVLLWFGVRRLRA
ncbi:MAG TPA: DnaJ domain-containing protein [Acidimicrobiia bacterium]|nr:DnaJ domain-containing protein [Acidimicrobiia bacterium]